METTFKKCWWWSHGHRWELMYWMWLPRPYPRMLFHSFSDPWSTESRTMTENFRDKQLVSLKSPTMWVAAGHLRHSSFLPPETLWHAHAVYAIHLLRLSNQLSYETESCAFTMLVFKSHLCYFKTAPKHKSLNTNPQFEHVKKNLQRAPISKRVNIFSMSEHLG